MRTLVDAIHKKFDDVEEEGSNNSFIQVFVPKSGPHSRSRDTGQLHLPERLTLENLEISCAGDGKDISELCGHIKELDLTKNNITDWKEVFKILDNTPCLYFLNLTLNPLENETFVNGPGKMFPNMRDIALNSTGVSWPVIAKLLSCFPSLVELHVSLNSYRSVDLPEDFIHSSLTKLFVNNCEINDWAHITKLGRAFPCLQMLTVMETRISRLSSDTNFTEFPVLSVLNLSKCQITSWDELDKFRQFPSLTNLKITDLAFIENWEEKQRRQHLVARLPNISQLNGGSTISDTEREDAERAFLRFFMDSHEKPNRYYELEVKHGKLDPLANVKFERSDYLKLLVKFEKREEYMDVFLHQTDAKFKKILQNFTGLPQSKMDLERQSCIHKVLLEYTVCSRSEFWRPVKFEEKEEYMDVFLHQTVGTFKTHLCKFTGLPVQKMRMFYIEMCDGQVIGICELKLPGKKLLNIHMYDGDEIHIRRKECT